MLFKIVYKIKVYKVNLFPNISEIIIQINLENYFVNIKRKIIIKYIML
jgi:hypothetical protein